jgi:hypothetical protein
MTDSDRLLTVSEGAERLRLNPETIRRWLRDGHLSGVWLEFDKAGGRSSKRDLDIFLRARSTTKERSR